MRSQSELEEFLSRLRDYRARLARDGSPVAGPGDRRLDDVAELGEDLLLAEEELRVQHEELVAVRLEMEHMLARTAELFGTSSTAHVITDQRGMIVDATTAAWQLFDTLPRNSRRPMVSMFATEHRRSIRSLISTVEQDAAGQHVEAALARRGTRVRIAVERRTEPHSGKALLHWHLTPSPEGDSRPLLRLVNSDLPTGTADPTVDGELGRLLSLARSDLASELSADQGPDFLLRRVVALTVRWIPGTEHASVAQRRDDERLRTAAATDGVAAACDRLQVRLAEGPAFDASKDAGTIRVDDLRQDQRWPVFGPYAADLGIRSVLVCELPVSGRTRATLNLYSSQPTAFGPMAELVAPVFAARASIALSHADEVYNLRRAIASRQVIGQAVGILVERHRITTDEAFDRLVTASKNHHIKLRELARIVAETGEEPDQAHPR